MTAKELASAVEAMCRKLESETGATVEVIRLRPNPTRVDLIYTETAQVAS